MSGPFNFFKSRKAANNTAGKGNAGAPAKVCPVQAVTPWTLKVTITTNPPLGQPHDWVNLFFSAGIPAPDPFRVAHMMILNFTNTNNVDAVVRASTPGWELVKSEHVILAPGDDESISLTLQQWKLHVSVQSLHKGKWPAGNVSVSYAGAYDANAVIQMTSDSSTVIHFFNGPPANMPITLALADGEWRSDAAVPPAMAIKAPEEKWHSVSVRRRWKLTVNVTSDVSWWPEDDVTLSFPGGLPSQTAKLVNAPWTHEVTGFDDIDGTLDVTCPTWALVGAAPVLKLRPDIDSTVNVKVAAWRLKVTVESTTAFGWPKDDVTISIPGTAVAAKTLKMTAKTGFVHIDGFIEIRNAKLKAEVLGWTLEAEQDISIRPGEGPIQLTLKLKGVNVVFELLDAATPPVGVANEKVSVFREDDTAVPGAPAQTDGAGLVTLTNVPPETYKIKFPDRYDAEWEFSKEEDA